MLIIRAGCPGRAWLFNFDTIGLNRLWRVGNSVSLSSSAGRSGPGLNLHQSKLNSSSTKPAKGRIIISSYGSTLGFLSLTSLFAAMTGEKVKTSISC